MIDLEKIYLFRMTHIENIAHILQYGITHQNSINANKNYKAIGDNSLISNRNKCILHNGKNLGDYIPFYFGSRTPMLYVIQKGLNGVPIVKPENIIYCVTSVAQIINAQLNFIFTNGHAISTLSEVFIEDKINNIDEIVDFKAAKATYWIDDNDFDLKRRKEAEFLIQTDIPVDAILGYGVFDEISKENLKKIGVKADIIAIRPQYYF